MFYILDLLCWYVHFCRFGRGNSTEFVSITNCNSATNYVHECQLQMSASCYGDVYAGVVCGAALPGD